MTENELIDIALKMNTDDYYLFALKYSLYLTRMNDIVKSETFKDNEITWKAFGIKTILVDYFQYKTSSSHKKVTTKSTILGKVENIVMILKSLEFILGQVDDVSYKIKWTNDNVIVITSKNNRPGKLKSGEDECTIVIP